MFGLFPNSFMVPSPSRVVSRHLLSSLQGEPEVSGPFWLYIPPKLKGFTESLRDTLNSVWGVYHQAGLSLGAGPIKVTLGTGVQSFHDHTGNYVLMATHDLGKPRDAVLIHEMAHWYHHNVVPGGFGNPRIKAMYAKAMGELTTKAGVKRGMTYEKAGWDNPFTKDTPYVRKYEVVSVTKAKTTVKLLNPSPSDVKRMGPRDILEVVPTSYMERLLNPEVMVDVHGGVHPKGGISVWVPTEYAKTNANEWFAELVTPYVLHPSGTDPLVKKWIGSLVA